MRAKLLPTENGAISAKDEVCRIQIKKASMDAPLKFRHVKGTTLVAAVIIFAESAGGDVCYRSAGCGKYRQRSL